MIYIFNYTNNLTIEKLIKTSLLNTYGDISIKVIKRNLKPSDFGQLHLIVMIGTFKDRSREIIEQIKNRNVKVIILGNICDDLKKVLNINHHNYEYLNFQTNKNIVKNNTTQSNFAIISKRNQLYKHNYKRYFEYYSYEKEWNNFGYGKITNSNLLFNISSTVKLNVINELSFIQNKKKNYCGSYSGLWKNDNCILWFNRLAGPFDSFEWRVLENFVSNLKYKDFKCIPLVLEIPYKDKAVATVRLDCDEDLASSEKLVDFYKKKRISVSLAVVTNLLNIKKNVTFLKRITKSNIDILSHSKTHRPNWGGNFEAALWEGNESRNDIYRALKLVTNVAVSPFHQSPKYAVKALEKSGFGLLISGIIKNDPFMVISRAGKSIHTDKIVCLTQQCMLHGDIAESKNSLKDYYETIKLFKHSKMIFGYLDHPFSKRYKYGWENEKKRISYHKKIVEHLKQKEFTFYNISKIAEFIQNKNKIIIKKDNNKFFLRNDSYKNKMVYGVEYKGKKFKLSYNLIINE